MSCLNTKWFRWLLLPMLFVLFLPNTVTSQPDGAKLFKVNCSACHNITDKKLIGPGLAGVESRWEDRDLLFEWIKNSAAVLESGDPYANALYDKYKSPMPAQPVNDEEIEAILSYINNPPAEAGPAPGAEPSAEGVAAEGDGGISWYVMLAILLLLFAVMSMMRNLTYTLRKLQAEKDGKPIPEQLSVLASASSWVGRNKTLVAIILIIVGVGAAKAGWDALLNIGIYQGYAPEQPIKFSHKVHAGTQKIDCNYCHSSARNSKTSGIPSANVCMNCHKFIGEGPMTGTTEISKIYDAIGYDPEAQAYTAESTGPIKWVKVHNLPDHAYFNHSQHVTVGNIACQTCHGEVEKMDVVEQFAPLTMGWCINCHRETGVSDEGNGYYDEIHARMPEDMKEEIMKDGKVSVSEMGGLECAKCHY